MMLRIVLVVCLCLAQVSCYPRHEDEEARVLSEVWEAMDKHRGGDDIIVVPRGPGHGDSSSESHSSESHGPSHGPSGPSHDESSDRSSESEKKPEAEHLKSESASHETESSPSGDESSYDKVWNKFNRLGDMMSQAVDRLRQDDREIRELEGGSSSSLTVCILEWVGAVVLGLVVAVLLVFGAIKGLKGIKAWKAMRQSERLVDQEAPNMDGTGYQSGYNP